MNLSIVIPAHNEEQFIEACIKSIFEHCINFKINPEVIVVLNRCTDRTGEIATRSGAKLISNDSRNLAKIRNAGINLINMVTGTFLNYLQPDKKLSGTVLPEKICLLLMNISMISIIKDTLIEGG